jgi:hypothetical protein
MRESMPAPGVETLGNGALNRQENPSWPAVEDGQFTLGSAEEKCRQGASLIAAQVKASQRSNGFTLGTVASLAGKETPYVSKVFDVEAPHAALQMLAAVILLDKDRTFLRGLARAAGCDVVERPRLTPEQKYERLIATLERHGPVGRALIDEALEDA